jgi:hypothetical protein
MCALFHLGSAVSSTIGLGYFFLLTLHSHPSLYKKLMNLMRYANEQGKGFCVEWLGDGRSFVINDPEKFTRNVVPKFFKQTKFSSFTRKLYRWGFRQVNRGIGPDDPIIFGNEFFQRDNAEIMAKMRSITAATSRKQDQHQMPSYAMKRPFDGPMDENMHKRMMFDHYLQNKANHYMHNPAAMYAGMHGGMHDGESLSLTNALYPNMGMGGGHSQNMMGMHGNNGHGYDLMKGNGMMNQYVPHHQNMQSQQQGQYQNQSSTAEIVNAAISALRYAN